MINFLNSLSIYILPHLIAVILIYALVNQILLFNGHTILPIGEEQLTEFVGVAFVIVTSLIAWWKNNSFTKEAIAADLYMNQLKSQR